jgi:hypothetical protein
MFVTYQKSAAILAMVTALFGCSSDDQQRLTAKSTSQDSDATNKGNSIYPELERAPEIDPDEVTGGKTALLNARYGISVKSAFNIEVCKGDLQIHLNVNFGSDQNLNMLEFPSGLIDCGDIGTIDPKTLLGATTGGPQSKMFVKDGIIYVNAIGRGTYSPHRPMFPAFLSESKDILKDLLYTEKVKVRDTRDQKEASGEVIIEMVHFETPYTLENLKVTFPRTIRFSVINRGFEGVEKMPNMLFKKMEFVFSMDPIALLHIHFEGTAGDAIASADAVKVKSDTTRDVLNTVSSASKQDDFFGNITRNTLNGVDVSIDLTLQSMAGLELPEATIP